MCRYRNGFKPVAKKLVENTKKLMNCFEEKLLNLCREYCYEFAVAARKFLNIICFCIIISAMYLKHLFSDKNSEILAKF